MTVILLWTLWVWVDIKLVLILTQLDCYPALDSLSLSWYKTCFYINSTCLLSCFGLSALSWYKTCSNISWTGKFSWQYQFYLKVNITSINLIWNGFFLNVYIFEPITILCNIHKILYYQYRITQNNCCFIPSVKFYRVTNTAVLATVFRAVRHFSVGGVANVATPHFCPSTSVETVILATHIPALAKAPAKKNDFNQWIFSYTFLHTCIWMWNK